MDEDFPIRIRLAGVLPLFHGLREVRSAISRWALLVVRLAPRYRQPTVRDSEHEVPLRWHSRRTSPHYSTRHWITALSSEGSVRRTQNHTSGKLLPRRPQI